MMTSYQRAAILGFTIGLVAYSAYGLEPDVPEQEKTAMVTLIVDGMQKSRSGAT